MTSEMAIPQTLTRGNVSGLLRADKLSSELHQLYDSMERQKKLEKKKPKRKGKSKGKEKCKTKRDRSPEKLDQEQPVIELPGNASSFAVYCAVRQVVMEYHIKKVSEVCAHLYQGSQADSDSELDEEDKGKDAQLKLPKIVSLGLCGVFELIRQTHLSDPGLCTMALQALLNMLQGQTPEGLKNEPLDVTDALYHLLLDLSGYQSADPEDQAIESHSLPALACSCLLSLVVARGDTGKILSAMATLLISTSNLAAQQVQVPAILTSLQKSIHAVLLGKTCAPDWLSKGIPDTSKIDATAITELAPLIDKTHYTIASDGKYIYIHNVQGLHKVGSGYGETIRGHVYNSNPDFYNDEPGWLAFASDLLFFKPESETKNRLAVINREKLHVEDLYEIEGDDYGPCVMFSDGENIGHMASSKDESFVVRTFSPICSPMPLVSELPLKLARKCLDVFGLSWFEPEKKIHTINLGIEDIASVMAGKDFAMVRTPTGKILYTGRSQSLGIKQGGPAPGKWAELPIVKSPKIVQYSIGHEGSHALLVAEDGSVFFVGTSKRGEDGDGSLSKARRQPKPLKPKKMIKMEGKNIVFSACNSGTSALVTKEGELYMFGKDKTYTDSSTGLVSDLRDIVITSVALGKAHAVVLSKQGHIYTFGINNKGQCGRDYVAGPARETSTPITMADEEEEPEDDTFCLPGRHRWVTEQCMVCVMCGQCTGYGSSCISNERPRPDRGPGMPCGCGSGDSGCAVCGVCRSCAGEGELDSIVGESANSHPLVAILARNAADVLPPFDLILGHHGDGIGSVSPKVEQRHKLLLHSINRKDKSKVSVEPGGSDYEQDHVKSTSLPPARVHLCSGDIPVTQIACGQQHTVVLLANGEVYTFGSNQYGQLGQGDINIRGSPSKVQLKSAVIQVAAGSYHTVLLTAAGQVFTFGSHQKGQLGRPIPDDDKVKEKKGTWFALPGLIPGIGAKHGRRAAWVGASGDQTFLRIDELLINAHTLSKSTIIANSNCIGLIATAESGTSNMNSLMISRLDGSCRNFSEKNQASLTGQALCLDPVYDVLWSYEPVAQVLSCYSVIHSEARHLSTLCEDYCDILRPELAMPTKPNTLITRSHSALFLLACLDTLTTAQQFGLTIQEDEKEKQAATKIYSKDDFSVVNRFESHGGGWGYSGHSIEAIRFMADTDILLGGFGLFGGRGDYFGKIKVLELGPDGGDNESYGEVLAETEEMSYECGAREKYPMLFPEPVLLHANHWYVAWARISGPSSDCGSSGQLTVTTDDQVVFKFKSSKKSNNGTDVNAGQIPQILYRLPSHDSTTTSRKNDVVEPAHVLSREFSRTVSPDCFEALLKLLTWSWHTFCLLTGEVRSLKGSTPSVAQLDLDRLVYISTAALRLIRIYICEVYPGQGATKKTPPETSKIAECVGDHRALLRKILADSRLHLLTGSQRRHDSDKSSSSLVERMTNRILDECHNTFTACFHAFYPTAALKWSCLCELLNILDPGQVHSQGQAAIEGYSRLLSAVMEALCHATIKLTNIMPINCEYGTEQLLKQQFSGEDNTNSSSSVADASQFPLLTCHLTNRLEKDSITGMVSGHNSFREVLDKLLMLIVLPVRQSLNEEKQTFPSALVSSTCSLISALLSELAASATGSEIDLTGTTRPLLTTPTRFTRTSQSAYWNTGNGSPDAVCFSVDRPGIVIAGVCVYGGAGHYDYQVDLLDDQSEHSSDPSHTGRWNTLETVRGSYGPEDCINDIAEIKFDRPVPIKENVKYAISLHNRGSCTLNGDAGLSKVKCPDGTNFTFSPCSLSTNGTNHTRGQIPQILYYSAPQEGENNLQSGKALVEYQARKNAMNITSAIFKAASDLLHRAQGTHMECLAEILGQSTMFTTLLPVCVAYIGPVATMDPRAAVHVLGLVQEIIPAIADLNCQLCPPSVVPSPTAVISNSATDVTEANTTSQHYAVVQSDHPYKPATVSNYKVSFPSQVKWMVLEFDPQCGTAQIEDTLQLYIPAKNIAPNYKWLSNQSEEDDLELSPRWPVYQKFSTKNNWPSMGLVLPGNEVEFSLETASDYVKDDKACFYGFKCTVIGYDWSAKPEEGLALLEKEISYLGGLCASSLMRKDIILPLTTVDEMEEDLDLVEETAQQIFKAHSELLGKGFALAHAPSINQALDGNLPFSWSSNERAFLKDFINCAVGTSGGRLAAWLQPESYLDPKHCQIQCNKDELQAGWPTVITILTKDQYGQPVHVPNLMMEVKAVPIMNDVSTDDRKAKRLSRCEDENCLTFGGHPPPKLDTSYIVTVKDKKDAYHAICMMKAYENYSFEELRYAAPVMRQPSENMLVRADDDGTYSASWTPSSTGWYKIQVSFDGYEAGEVLKVNVKEPVQGTLPPQRTQSKRAVHQPNKMRRFVAGWSAGLRVRINPSLQSEQIGVIKPNGIISFIDEIHNNDGVWIRLSQESMHQCCNTNSNGYNEAWALQYNQHLGKTLLIPVDEPKSILDEIIKNAIRKELSMERKTRRGGPGHYQVVKCGSSGHNIRCRPNLKATPVGMLVMGNQFMAVEELTNSDGIWVKLDKESMSRYCTEVEGQAWSLACGHDSITYLQHEADIRSGAEDHDVLNIGATTSGGLSTKGFDFTSAQQTPSFSAFGAAGQVPSFGSSFGSGTSAEQDQPSSSSSMSGTWQKVPGFGSQSKQPSTSHGTGKVPTFGQPTPTPQAGIPCRIESRKAVSSVSHSGQNSLSVPSGSTSHKSATSHRNITAPAGPSARLHENYDSMQDLPPELQGISVKDLVKALGKVKLERGLTRALGGMTKADRHYALQCAALAKGSSPHGKKSALALTSELQGTSIKELVRVLGESRVNGNGVTPPRTPPGTPKKTLSRSSSPRTGASSLVGASRQGTQFTPCSSPHTPPCTPPCTPPMARRMSAGGSTGYSTPPLTSSAMRNDYRMSSTSPRLGTSSRRSHSVSPQRPDSPFSLVPRLSSMSPIRSHKDNETRSRSPSSRDVCSYSPAGSSESFKGHFSIGVSPPREDIRMSPKTARKDRSKVLRSRRERGSPPAGGHEPVSAPGTLERPQVEKKVQQAMSPSVAQCTRAVFAAFMWHEGIVHDAMACASFLKFHPGLPKELPNINKPDTTKKASSGKGTPSFSLKHQNKGAILKDLSNINMNEAARKLEWFIGKKMESASSSATQPEGVVVASGMDGSGEKDGMHEGKHTKHEKPHQSKTKEQKDLASIRERYHSTGYIDDGQNSSSIKTPDADTGKSLDYGSNRYEEDKDSKVPPTLKYIVYFWQEIAMATQNIVTQNLILPSPGLSTLKKSDKKDKDKDKDKKGKKKKKEMSKGLVGAGRGNLFGEAAVFGGPGQAAIGGGIAGDRETKCELCGGMFPHPVTYHMKDAHPGCGRHAKGQGYNSGGNYCPGWAGNCGDGGKGGSTWYLMCEACREKYLREKQQLTKEKAKKSKKKNTPVKQPAVLQILEPHLIMKNNASFLLNLASASGLTIPPACSPVRSQGCILPNVSEIHFDNNSPFPPTPFLYLAQHGAHGADSAFADDLVFSDDGYYTSKPRSRGLSKSSQFDGVTTTATANDKEQQQQQRRLCRSGSVSGDNSHEMLETLDEKSKSAEVSPSEGHPSGTVKPVLLQRSVSEITKRSGDVIDVDSSGAQYKENDDDDDDECTQQSGQVTRNYRMMIGRRRNNSGGMTDGGMSLLKHLSSSMSRLIQTIPKSAAPGSIPVSKTFHRPVMAFVMQRHDLDSLQLGMKQALRKVTCRVFALQAFNWLIRSVSQPTCLHDLFWCFTASLTPPPPDEDEDEENADKKAPEKRESEQDKDTVICEHPLSDITIAGLAVRPLQDTFHTFLQSVSDVMMYLPPGSALQQMAVRCWCLAFQPSDHLFLHKSHVFSNISKILSKSDEGWGIASVHIDDSKILAKVECLADLTSMVDIRSSSRQAMIGSLTDNSTETFWESGDDDRNKAKSFILTCDKNIRPKMICVHIDNSRDLVNKVTSVSFHGGMSLDELTLLKHFDLEVRHSGWVCCHVKVRNTTIYKLEMKGPDNTLRVRQIKVLGELDGVPLNVGRQHSPLVMQQKACEAETLKVFRLLTSEVFGKLISGDNEGSDNKVLEPAPSGSSGASEAEQNDGELDLKEHMVGILFSRSKLTHLQKQVCAHIVQAIRKETIKVQEEWEDQLQTERQISDSTTKSSDTYCFELLSMVLALSGSAVGRFYLARQLSLLQDMLTLMHTSTPRVQRQVLALLRRVLPEVSPRMLAQILGVQSLPPEDISILCANSDSSTLNSFEIHKQGILDVFLSCIAKAMTVQMKVKGQSGSKSAPVVFKLSDCLPSSNVLPNRWWLRGSSSSQMAEATITLLKDLASGKLSGSWAAVTKSAVAENILSLTKLDEPLRQSAECIKTPTLWLALASLCVLDKEHVARLSSGHWVKGEENIPRPTCDNHDDGETPAIILCNDCGNLCGDCDRFLHLHRRTRSHTRQVFKEEKKAIKVDLHEGCGRTKLFWVMALADSKTLKAVVEFREGDKGKFSDGPSSTGPTGTCRFCGTSANTGLLAIGNVCSQPECQEFARMSCSKTLPCGHQCGGIANEDPCLPCLYGCISHNQERLKQDSDDMCMICFTDALSAAPAIQLTCGHVFHLHCCRNVLERRWVGPRITFGFSACPICKASIDHPVLKSLLDPIRQLYEDVRRKALMRLEYEGLDKSEAITTPGTRFHNDPAGYAMERYAYYVCYKCQKAYYGGEARCEEQAAAVDHYNPAELVCGACSDVSRAQMCPKHGTDFLEYKCRYCCSVAVFFCFGTTHFCNACHDDFQRVTNIPKTELPHCPAGPKARQLDGDECPLHIKHPPTGEEFALGCGVCRNAHTF